MCATTPNGTKSNDPEKESMSDAGCRESTETTSTPFANHPSVNDGQNECIVLLRTELAALADEKEVTESRLQRCKTLVLERETELEKLRKNQDHFQKDIEEKKAAYLATHNAKIAKLQEQQKYLQSRLTCEEEILKYLTSKTDVACAQVQTLEQPVAATAPGQTAEASVATKKRPFTDAPMTEDFSKISTARVHKLTGVSKLSQLWILKRNDMMKFATWIAGPNGRGYDKNPEFLSRCELQTDNDLWKAYCGHESGKFIVSKRGYTKKFLTMRLALYLDLEIDQELDDDTIKNEYTSKRPAEDPANSSTHSMAKRRRPSA